MTVHVTVARKRCDRVRNPSPTGLVVNTMCRLSLTCWMKWAQQLSAVSTWPLAFTAPRMALQISSLSSWGNRSGMSPEASRSLMNTRNSSLVICASVKRNVTPSPFTPAFLYIFWRSSLKLLTP